MFTLVFLFKLCNVLFLHQTIENHLICLREIQGNLLIFSASSPLERFKLMASLATILAIKKRYKVGLKSCVIWSTQLNKCDVYNFF